MPADAPTKKSEGDDWVIYAIWILALVVSVAIAIAINYGLSLLVETEGAWGRGRPVN